MPVFTFGGIGTSSFSSLSGNKNPKLSNFNIFLNKWGFDADYSNILQSISSNFITLDC